MNFGLATWKRAAMDKLGTIDNWLDRRKTEDVLYLVYGTLCGLSLWPLVEAAQAGQLLPVMMALGSVAGGVGGNLIAEQVQHWKEQADAIDEAGVAEWVVEHADDPELRETLDTILEELEAIPQAQAALDEAGRQWFRQTLRAELERLGNLARFEGDIVGGDKVGGDKIAVGDISDAAAVIGRAGMAVKGPVEGDVLGPGARKEVHYHTLEGVDPKTQRLAYLNRVFEATGQLSLAGIDPKAASESEARLNLGAVYTALLTLTPEAHELLEHGEFEGREVKRLSALEQLNNHRRLVLLGNPGSGKSTFVNFVAMCLAGEELKQSDVNMTLLTAPLPDDEGKDCEERQPWQHGVLLPVRVILRDLAARGLPSPGQKATAEHLWQFITSELQSASMDDYAPHLRRELLEKGGLLLLDGLDEVPEADRRREQIRQMVEDFAASFPKCRVLVTSRTYAYQKQDWRLPGFAETVLAPFSTGQIRRFVDRWYAHIAVLRGMHADDAQGRAELLKRAIFSSDRLEELAKRPLLLTLMASLHAWRGGSLPEKREELYADTVDLLLDWWERPKVVRDAKGVVTVLQPSLAEWLEVDRDKVRGLLDELAYQAHQAQPDLIGTADVPEGDLLSGLMRLSRNPEVRNNPALVLDYLSQRAGLLLPRGVGVHTFPHRTFQEYLAACYLTDYEYPDQVAELARQDPNRWREVALLAGAKAARGSTFAVWALVEALCYREPEDDKCGLGDSWGAHLAGQALVETADLEQVSERNKTKVERVRKWLVCVLEGGELPAVERAQTGDALARLGDPRPGVSLRLDGLPDIAWCEVPAGPFLMGTREEGILALKERFGEYKHYRYEWEVPQHEITLPAFRISKYPVTNAQYAAFVQDGGYTEKWQGCWTKTGWEWKERNNLTKPYDPGEPFNLANHPVIGVTWYEALAYCRWLTEKLRTAGKIGPDEAITLPSEAEWEKAARGTDGRRYPWGDEADPNLANYSDTGIGNTSTVGCFPSGASPYGVLDLSGNVWEWTRNLWGKDLYEPALKYPYDPKGSQEDLSAGSEIFHVVRGGSFTSDAPFMRAMFRGRGRGLPDGQGYGRGFRCVLWL